jgi:hypothetical protein
MKFKFLLLKLKTLLLRSQTRAASHADPARCRRIVVHIRHIPVQEKQFCICICSEMHRPLFFSTTQLPSSHEGVGATTASRPSAASMPPHAQFVIHSDYTVTHNGVTVPMNLVQLTTSTSCLDGAQVIRSGNIVKIKLCLLIHFSLRSSYVCSFI